MLKKIIVFTALMGNYNKLREIKNQENDVEYICFTDQNIVSKSWRIIKGCTSFNDNNLNAKIHKVLEHMFLKCDYSLWLDASIEFYGNVHNLINEYLNDDTDIVLFKHKIRDCPYCEAKNVIAAKLANPKIVQAQLKNYSQNGLQIHSGLSQGGVILRRHSERMELFNLSWWAEICRYTKRDQLSLDFCMNKAKLKKKYFNLPTLYEENGYFRYFGHKKHLSHIAVLLRSAIYERTLFDPKKWIPYIKKNFKVVFK